MPHRTEGVVPGILPITGFDLKGIAEVALSLGVVGSGALLASRRRPNRTPDLPLSMSVRRVLLDGGV